MAVLYKRPYGRPMVAICNRICGWPLQPALWLAFATGFMAGPVAGPVAVFMTVLCSRHF
jgi:hypothetical protein